ncbi:transcriptional repressor [Balneolaceae bacterium ANBcel3]|nr:transcriptional repressor [Balneolaceae bacterium ANBcel3]
MAAPASEDLIVEVKEIFQKYLKEKKHRQTPERLMVLEKVYRADGHFDADEMYFQMNKTGNQVSRATVYNTLDLLLECGLVQKQQFGKNQSKYERAYAYRQHDHIICNECGQVIEFCDPRIQEIKTMLEEIHNLSIEGHSLHFYAKCKDSASCKEKKNSPRV